MPRKSYKPDATELPRGPIEAKHLLSTRASAGRFFGIKAHLSLGRLSHLTAPSGYAQRRPVRT